jgi:hypothetical protein
MHPWKNFKHCIGLVLAFAAVDASAAQKWAHTATAANSSADASAYTVQSYSVETDANGNEIFKFTVEEAVTSTSCLVGNSSKHFAAKTTTIGPFVEALLSVVASAKALEWKVKVKYSDSTCYAEGAKLLGVEVVPASSN